MIKVKAILIFFLILVAFSSVSMAGMKEVNKAKEFMKARMFPQAIAILEKEIKNNPTNAEGHFQLGICYVLKGDNYSADERFASAVSINPDKYGYLVGEEYKKAGVAFLNERKIERAEEAFTKATRYNPKLIGTIGEEYKNAGVAYLNAGQIEDADRLFNRALQCKPQLGGVIAEEYLKAGQNYLDWQPEIAEKVFTSATAFSPALGEKICDIYFEKGKAGANKIDFEFLEKARKYSNRHDEEILGIMINKLPGKTVTVRIDPSTVADIVTLKEDQEWRYLFASGPFSHRVNKGDDVACWREVNKDNNLPWNAGWDGMVQVKANDTPLTLIINIGEVKMKAKSASP